MMKSTLEVSPKDNLITALKESGAPALSIEQSKKADKALAYLEFPTSKNESWKYTSVKNIINKEYKSGPVNINSIEEYKIHGLDAYILVFVNGFFDEKLSSKIDEKNILVTNLAKSDKRKNELANEYLGKYASIEKEIFTALNTAHATDGAFIYLPANAILDKPVHIINVTSGNSISQPRNLIIAEKGSNAKLIFTYTSENINAAFVNTVTEIILKENSQLECFKLQNETEGTSHISTEQIHQEKNSTFTLHTATLNGSLVRNNVNVVIAGENCESNLFGIYLTDNKQHVDNHTLIDHTKPHCNSNEHYKGIMNGHSTGVFNGKVYVRRDAQKTNAFQSNQNILLSDDATINSKPELEIYADDVKCSHGSTTGQFDEEAVFYLRARGISETSAKKMLVHAFADEILDKITVESYKEYVKQLLEHKLL